MPKGGGSARRRGGEMESFACCRLEEAGCRILCRNYTILGAELDIVAEEGAYLLFIEVRARRQGAPDPLETVDRPKRRRLLAAAERYLYEHPTALQPRFDVFAVVTDREGRVLSWRHEKGAFTADDA